MWVEQNTTVQVVQTKRQRVCDRCGKPATEFKWDDSFRIPVVVKRNSWDKEHYWEAHTVDACRDCIEMLWRMFNCRGVTREQMKKDTSNG